MRMEQLKKMEERFEAMVAACDVPPQSESLKDLKHRHSYRVRDVAKEIALSLGWPEGDVVTATALGLLHDVARFQQIREFGHLRDHDSFDHGLRGAEILEEERWLEECDAHDREIILAGVRWHTAHVISPDMCPDHLPFVQLIRDADKLDILDGVADELVAAETRNGPLPPPAPALVETVLAGGLVDYVDVKTLSDMLMAWLAWVYDMNFPSARAILRQKGFMEKLIGFLPDSPEMRQLALNIDARPRE